MTETRNFKPTLGLLDSTTIVVGSMIGSGIFIVSADIARTVGSPGWLLVAWLLSGVFTIFAALSYGELAAMMPHAGGQYVYLREAYNPLIGFLYGWTMFAVIQTGTIAAVAIAFAKFFGVLFPWFSPTSWIFLVGTFGPYSMPFGQMGPYNVGLNTQNLLGIISIIILTWVNTRGVQKAKIVQNVFTFAKTAALIGLILLGLIIGANNQAISENFSNIWNASWTTIRDGIVNVSPLSGVALLSALGAAMVGSLFSSDAWNNITFTAGEVKDPKRNIPLSLFYGTIIVTVIYIAANVVYLLSLPLIGSPNGATVAERGIQFATQDRVGIATANIIFGDGASIIMAVLIIISTFGCNNGLILAGARVYYAMAKDKLFFQSAGELNEKQVPASGLVAQGIWASVLCLSGTYGDMLDYVIFAVMIFYILTIAGIFILRKKKPDVERPYKAFGYPYIPIVYIVLATLFCINLLFVKPQFTWPGLFIVLLGIPIFLIWKNKQARLS